ncbi:MAG TPA: nuclease-related domain-containing protein [Chthoniobacteraceae bacterium]|jgi:hypothetical protein|nr:nuclease-related domain-containing protein [Chthoniobacteraceae bacterium]
MKLAGIATVAWCMVPIFVLLGMLFAWRWRLDLQKERIPISDKLLRPAGESLRRRIGELDDKLGEMLVFAFAAPLLAAIAIGASVPTISGATLISPIMVGIAGFIWLANRFFRVLSERRNTALGFHGERAVAEELNQLMLEGCRVFHDVPMDPYGNIDHVVVAPSGIYAVETKTRRKRPVESGKRDYEVVFTGKELEFPHGRDSHGIEQARQQADRLRAYLTNAIGEQVSVIPILTLPGWMVASRVNGKLKVLNPKQIQKVVIRPSERLLSAQMIQRIVHQLDQKCRDVEL